MINFYQPLPLIHIVASFYQYKTFEISSTQDEDPTSKKVIVFGELKNPPFDVVSADSFF